MVWHALREIEIEIWREMMLMVLVARQEKGRH
jgi:hypothetical protein